PPGLLPPAASAHERARLRAAQPRHRRPIDRDSGRHRRALLLPPASRRVSSPLQHDLAGGRAGRFWPNCRLGPPAYRMALGWCTIVGRLSVKLNVLPWPIVLSTQIRPPWSSTNFFANAR